MGTIEYLKRVRSKTRYNKIGVKIGRKFFSERGYEIRHRAFLAKRG